MASHPVSDEVAATLGAFVAGGDGPTHSVLTGVFGRAGYGRVAPYDRDNLQLQPNKQERVRRTVIAAVCDPARSRDLVDGLLSQYRAFGFFRPNKDPAAEAIRQERVTAAASAFARVYWELTQQGELRPAGVGAVISTEGRPAIEEQLDRLRRATEDPGLMLGTAKEMLESTAKYVLEEFSVPYTAKTDFDHLWHLARDRLGLIPQSVDTTRAGGEEVREILQSSWSIARMTNTLRNHEGTGHGRTLPTSVTPDIANLVVREACSVAELVLATLDRRLGR